MTTASRPAGVADLSRAEHDERQRRAVSREGLQQAAGDLRCGGKFRRVNGTWLPQSYAGVAVVAMAYDGDAALANALGNLRANLHANLDAEACYLLPASSYHQTIANTFSDARYQRHVVDNGARESYPRLLSEAFTALDLPGLDAPRMELIGLSLFRTAFGLLGVFPDDHSYARLMTFRQQFYGHEALRALGLERTRPFIAHVTLGYIEAELTAQQRERMTDLFADINTAMASRPLSFAMPCAEARCYDHLAAFEHGPGYPSYSFVDNRRIGE